MTRDVLNEYNRRSSPTEKIVSSQGTKSFSLVNDSGVSLGEDFLELEDQKSADRKPNIKAAAGKCGHEDVTCRTTSRYGRKTKRALRGTTYGDVSSETMLLLF